MTKTISPVKAALLVGKQGETHYYDVVLQDGRKAMITIPGRECQCGCGEYEGECAREEA